jgi:N-acetylmuramoyl-L-alanine amidase
LALLGVAAISSTNAAAQQQSPTGKPTQTAPQQRNLPQTAAQQGAPLAAGQKASTPTPPAATTPPPAPVYSGPTIVLDPAHGGTDTGARGETAIEKDLVLDYARMARAELQNEGFHVVMTRNDDSNPSYADRAAIANAYRDAIFISFHVSSTGTFGTVHAYYYQFGSLPKDSSNVADGKNASAAGHTTSLVTWEDAQLAHVDASEQLANALQAQFAQRFAGSPAIASPAAVRELRSVDAPAVAIEVASVSTPDPNALAALAGPLAVAVARGAQAFRPAGAPQAGASQAH